ncbi:carbohydrate ABC transporter permease [Cohnella candidum]|uniref:Sugar ABC transporter permease n=1 Tax=Cohnella candidum TaxID=2674991 RepID=A0A3G3K3X2_9BACL|nr:sugar ABC transporter permease [Cohnella candidum]AYQ75158.1 sugar ABC transporter permease [Cohnella candidum]
MPALLRETSETDKEVSILEKPAQLQAGGMRLSEKRKDILFLALLIAPAIVLLLFTIGIPIIKSLYLSFFDVTLLSMKTLKWNAFGNYHKLFADNDLLHSIGVTFRYVLTVVSLQFALGMMLALILNGKLPFRRALRTVILIPWVIPTIIGALLWMWLFQPQYGVMNFILQSLNLSDKPLQWLSDVHLALWAVTIAALWKQLPFMVTMLLAGMQGIPGDMYEAAMIDGAGKRQQFFHITLPMLKNTIKTVTLIACIENFKMFPLFWIMTSGGPVDATTTLSILSYKTAFIDLDLGKGAATGALWLIIMLVFSWVYNRLFSIGEGKGGAMH